MIYTVTLNPSLDFYTELDDLTRGRINYTKADYMAAGGRAINISRVLRRLGLPTMATGFIGGETGAFVQSELKKEDIPSDFVQIEGTTRINLNIFVDRVETRILGPGPEVSINEINELMYYIARVREGDFVILGGSLPTNMSGNVYDRIIEICVVNKAQFLPIIPGDQLFGVLSRKPLLITPTLSDISNHFGEKPQSLEEAVPLALRCLEEGAQNVVVTAGREGSLLVTGSRKLFLASGPKRAILSSTSTNVSLVAGFVGNYMKTNDPVESFRFAQAASNAAYYVKDLPTRDEMYEALDEVEMLPLN